MKQVTDSTDRATPTAPRSSEWLGRKGWIVFRTLRNFVVAAFLMVAFGALILGACSAADKISRWIIPCTLTGIVLFFSWVIAWNQTHEEDKRNRPNAEASDGGKGDQHNV